MPLAQTRLETLQICKLLQCVREEERVQIEKLTLNGVPHLINYNEPTTGETALSTAAAANNDSMIEYLIELGAYPDVKDFEGRTAVMRAAELGNIQCVEVLAKAECNMELTDNHGKGLYQLQCKFSPTFVNILLKVKRSCLFHLCIHKAPT